MCGIAGFTTFSGISSDRHELVRAMTDTLTPRGPDGEGYYVDDHASLGHRRLSIIDIDGGAQPMDWADKRYHLVFNGEIYNYIELRAELEEKGEQFSTTSDTEVLLRHLVRHGPGGLKQLNGMFALALWDRQEQTLFLARDRIGIKPLYYAQVNGDIMFASEMKALMKHPSLPRELDTLSVSKFFTFGCIPAPNTIFRGVHKLEPGTWIQFGKGQFQKQLYWDIPLEDHPISGRTVDECAEEMMELLRDSIRKRLRSDVPVGVFLSGGLDSSTIVALASQEVTQKLHTFSVGFEEASYDESPYARQVAQQYGTEHHHEVLSLKRAVDLIPTVMGILDEPFADASILPTYLLSQFTVKHVKVCLGGDGGDELFAGYPSFQAHKITEKLSVLPTTWRDGINRLAKKLPVSHKYASASFLLQQFFKGAGISPEIRFFLWMGCYGNEMKRGLLSDRVRQELLRENPFEDIINYVRQSGLVSDFERILYLCMKIYLQDQILVKVDRASMANSLEVRVPFLDHTMVEYVSGVQSVYKLKGLTTKFLLKKAAAPVLPKSIRHRRKAGFMIPVAQWIQKDLKEMIEDLCTEKEINDLGLFNYAFIRKMLDDHYSEVQDYRKQIWPLLCFLTWRKNYGA